MLDCYYTTLTTNSKAAIMKYLREASIKTGSEAVRLREHAHGVFIGWQALVDEIAEPATYVKDHAQLWSLLEA